VAASLMLLGLVAHFYGAGGVERLGLTGYALIPLQTAANALLRPLSLVSASTRSVQYQNRHSPLPVVRGFLLALPVVTVFALFLASADVVFASYMEDLVNLDFVPDLSQGLWRGGVIVGVAWVVAGGLAYAMSRCHVSGKENTSRKASSIPAKIVSLGFIESATLLISVDLLFLVFVWIQFKYLFGGQANVTVEGYTYAEYARRGFFELLFVSILALGLLLGLHRLTRRETEEQGQIFNGLGSLLVGLMLVVLASAFQRLLLYEDAFGYTELRLYSHVFMLWLAFVFVWFLIVLWLRQDRFALGAFLAAVGFLTTLNVVNPDVLIARQNLARYRATGKLDVRYLTTLSEDVVPVLIDAKDQLNETDRGVLDEHLRRRLGQMAANDRWQSWPAFHLSRQRACDLLVEGQSNR
jgi:hypothetical protein